MVSMMIESGRTGCKIRDDYQEQPVKIVQMILVRLISRDSALREQHEQEVLADPGGVHNRCLKPGA